MDRLEGGVRVPREFLEISQSGGTGKKGYGPFFNLDMGESRDFTLASLINSGATSFLDMTSASGFISLRIRESLGEGVRVTLNDLSEASYRFRVRNTPRGVVNLNLDSRRDHLGKAQFVEIDPYGLSDGFFEAAVDSLEIPGFVCFNSVVYRGYSISGILKAKIWEQILRREVAKLEKTCSGRGLGVDLISFYKGKYWIKCLCRVFRSEGPPRSRVVGSREIGAMFPLSEVPERDYGPFWMGPLSDPGFYSKLEGGLSGEFATKLAQFLNEPAGFLHLENYEIQRGSPEKVESLVRRGYARTCFSSTGVK